MLGAIASELVLDFLGMVLELLVRKGDAADARGVHVVRFPCASVLAYAGFCHHNVVLA